MMNYRSPSKLFSWYYICIIFLILFIGIGATIFTYRKVASNVKTDLLVNVASIARAFDVDDIENLTGTEADLNNADYLLVKNQLENIRALNKESRFTYLLGYREDKIYFMVDSEPSSSIDYSPPGQIYEEATLLEKQIFLGQSSSVIEFSKDRWGSWMTALVPIIEDGKVIAVLGMDVSASKYYSNIYTAIAIPIISTIFILLIIFIGFFLRRNEEKYLEFKEKLISLATHDIRSPITSVSWIIETVLGDEEHIKDDNRVNLEDAKKRIKRLLDDVNNLLDSHNKKDL